MRQEIRWFIFDHETAVFVFAMAIVIALVFGAAFWLGDTVEKNAVHYTCYSGGVAVIDQDYDKTGLGAVLDPETHERVYFKGLECVIR